MQRAIDWLREEGWVVEETDKAGFPYDLVARRNGDVMYVEVKASVRPLETQTVRQVIGYRSLMPSVQSGKTRYVLYVAGPGLTAQAQEAARQTGLDIVVDDSTDPPATDAPNIRT